MSKLHKKLLNRLLRASRNAAKRGEIPYDNVRELKRALKKLSFEQLIDYVEKQGD